MSEPMEPAEGLHFEAFPLTGGWVGVYAVQLTLLDVFAGGAIPDLFVKARQRIADYDAGRAVPPWPAGETEGEA